MSLIFEDWGLIAYPEAAKKQLQYVDELVASQRRDTIVFCSHPPTITKGRATKEDDIFNWQGEVLAVSRGGRATYHGPSQLVIYPIIDLSIERKNLKAKDLHGLMRTLEETTCLALKEFGIKTGGQAKAIPVGEDEEVDATGVWYEDKKLASIGIAVRKWISYHGIAINLEHDPNAFKGLNPCGFQSETMTDVESILGYAVSREQFSEFMKLRLKDYLEPK